MRKRPAFGILIFSIMFLMCGALNGFGLAGGGAIVETKADSVNFAATNFDIEKLPTSSRGFQQLLLVPPGVSDQRVQREDLNQAKFNLDANAAYLRDSIKSQGSNITDDVIKDITEQIAGIPVKPEYNPAPRQGWGQSPLFFPKTGTSELSAVEQGWLGQNIKVGRIGLGGTLPLLGNGLQVYNGTNSEWFSGQALGERYGFGGPVVAFGKAKDQPALSIFDSRGIFVGGVTGNDLKSDYGLTAKYLMQAENSSRMNFRYSLNNLKNQQDYSWQWAPDPQKPIFKLGNRMQSFNYPPYFSQRHSWGSDFQPSEVMVPQLGMGYGDIFQISDNLNNRLLNFRGDSRQTFFDESTTRCPSPYFSEPVYPRSVLEEKDYPDDPLYKSSRGSSKGIAPVAGGLIGGALRIGGVGLGVGAEGKRGPNVADQYGIRRVGFLPKSDANSAWNVVDGSAQNTVVAVIDSGLDVNHPDGPRFIWTNPGEVAGNGIDDDGNGYVDDIHGWNFLDDNADLTDYRGHGTMVAGIIAASTNNGIGIAGINPGAVILPLKVADKYGNTNSLSIFRAIQFAVSNGAKVINISLGARGISKLEQLAINHANASGVLVVVAGGNDGADISLYGPASAGGALVVGALNYEGTRSVISNWGPNNALLAPGEEIYSLHSKDAPWEGPAADRQRLYTKASGTSFAAPMVSATASLILAKDPAVRPDQIADILLSTAVKIKDDAWEAKTGAGILDAAKALRAVPADVLNVMITGVKISNASVDIFATVRGAQLDYFTVELGRGQRPKSFQKIIGFYRQQADNDLVAHIDGRQLEAGKEWVVLVRATDQAGKDRIAELPLVIK